MSLVENGDKDAISDRPWRPNIKDLWEPHFTTHGRGHPEGQIQDISLTSEGKRARGLHCSLGAHHRASTARRHRISPGYPL